MEEDLTDSEREQLRKLAGLKTVAGCILRKWAVPLFSFFVLMLGIFTVFIVWKAAKSEHRFDAKTRLLYMPRKISRIDNMSDKQLMTVLDRSSLKRKVGETLPMSRAEKECLRIDLEIKQERKPSNLYTLTAHSPEWVGAVKKVNAYADILIAEYVDYRTRDLENWRNSILARKNTIQEQIAAVEAEESIAKGDAGVVAPAETLSLVNMLLSDQRRELSALNVQKANEEIARKHLEDQMGSDWKAIADIAPHIREKSAEIAQVDKELASLRTLYTDINPKVVGKMDERKRLAAELDAMLKERGIEDFNIDEAAHIEKTVEDLSEAQLKIDVLKQNISAIEAQIAVNEKNAETLTAAIPLIERLRVKRGDLEAKMRELDVQLGDVEYLQMSIGNDLRQIERAGGAGDKKPLRALNLVLALVATLIGTAGLAFWILVMEFFFGTVTGAKELGAYGDILVLGSLPEKGQLKPAEEKDVLGVVALNVCNADLPSGIVLVCRAAEVPPQEEFVSALDWSLTMAGRTQCRLDLVPALEFVPPEGGEPLLAAVRKASRAWFPVANRFSLAPAELQMLQADIATLRQDFDSVYVCLPEGLHRRGTFLQQVIEICDSVFVMVRCGKTPRSTLSGLRRKVTEIGKPMMGVATGAGKRAVAKEMENLK